MLPWVEALAVVDFFLGAVEGLAFLGRAFLGLGQRSGTRLWEECPAVVTGRECKVLRSVDTPLGLGTSNVGVKCLGQALNASTSSLPLPVFSLH